MKEQEPIMNEEQRLANLIREARQVYICGNGGSASTSEHFATDLVKKGFNAFALSSNSSIITMIGNDYGFDQIYSKQLEAFGKPDDLLIAISCSGTSPNVVRALEEAREKGIKSYSFEIFKTQGQHVLEDYQLLENEHLRFAHAVSNIL